MYHVGTLYGKCEKRVEPVMHCLLCVIRQKPVG